MAHDRPGLVAHRPAGLPEPPHEVDVLTDLQLLVEAAHRLEGGAADHERRGRHERHATPGSYWRFRRSAVERGMRPLVRGEGARGPTVLRVMMRARRRRRRVVEVREQESSQPSSG